MVYKQCLENFGFNANDLTLLEAHGIPLNSVADQMQFFQQGFPKLDIQGPAVLDHDILQLSKTDLERYQKQYPEIIENLELVKFVPASGAASRMFSDLLSYLQETDRSNGKIEYFLNNLHKFAFFNHLKLMMAEVGKNLEELIEKQGFREILGFMFSEEGLNFQNLPKALLIFHQYADHCRNALEEHLEEAGIYAQFQNKTHVHFTVSKDHKSEFLDFLQESIPEYQQKFGIAYQVSLSVQNPATDKVAVNEDNKVFRARNGRIIIRPGGHGALLDNLNSLDADVIFIKNIDNVTPDHLKGPMVRYKQALVGVLLEYQFKIFQYLKQVNLPGLPDSHLIGEIVQFIENNLGIKLRSGYHYLSVEERTGYLQQILDRPLRVCSVIRADQPTGGGPYWVKAENGDTTLQIIENAQLTNSNTPSGLTTEIAHITDMVCAVRDCHGAKFDLRKYVDPNTGFITEKSFQGVKIKVQEHPGLWNGAMAHWNTVLVEVPGSIFHPVKSVWDLLSASHQPEERSV